MFDGPTDMPWEVGVRGRDLFPILYAHFVSFFLSFFFFFFFAITPSELFFFVGEIQVPRTWKDVSGKPRHVSHSCTLIDPISSPLLLFLQRHIPIYSH